MNSNHTKDVVIIVAGFAVAAILFSTIGSRVEQPDQKCIEYGSKGYAINCENRPPKGWPLTYTYVGEGDSQLYWGSLSIDLGLWLVISGIITFGVFMILPDKPPKKKK